MILARQNTRKLPNGRSNNDGFHRHSNEICNSGPRLEVIEENYEARYVKHQRATQNNPQPPRPPGPPVQTCKNAPLKSCKPDEKEPRMADLKPRMADGEKCPTHYQRDKAYAGHQI